VEDFLNAGLHTSPGDALEAELLVERGWHVVESFCQLIEADEQTLARLGTLLSG
jgi:hypothetical protein